MTGPELIVVGGSAGALDLILEIAAALPERLRAPVVFVLHLQANQPSLVPELIARTCRRPTREIEDKMKLQPQAIYVAPPNYHVLFERDRTLALSVDPPVHWSRPSIDVLFESAADAYGAGVLGVILSGANDDGARGLARIHRGGGAAVVQDPASAQYPVMPGAAARAVGQGVRSLTTAELISMFSNLGGAPGEGMTTQQDSLR
ncbi:MAG TPA: chemotaxis protein CheB [Kofleriaceae bacterium]